MMDLQTAFESLLRLLADATFLPFAVPTVVVLTALVKQVPWVRTHVSPGLLALLFQAALWVIWLLASRAGMAEQVFIDRMDALTTILSGVSMFVIGSAGTQRLYESLQNRGVPVLGASRPALAANDEASVDEAYAAFSQSLNKPAVKPGRPPLTPKQRSDLERVRTVLEQRRYGSPPEAESRASPPELKTKRPSDN